MKNTIKTEIIENFMFENKISKTRFCSLNPATEIYNRPENNPDDDLNDSGTTIYKQDIEMSENDIRKHSRCLCYSCVPNKNPRVNPWFFI